MWGTKVDFQCQENYFYNDIPDTNQHYSLKLEHNTSPIPHKIGNGSMCFRQTGRVISIPIFNSSNKRLHTPLNNIQGKTDFLIPILSKDLNWQEMHSLRIQLMLSIFLKCHKKWWKSCKIFVANAGFHGNQLKYF